MTQNETSKSSEIRFLDNFEVNEERKYLIWNHITKRNEEYFIKKENFSLYVLYLEEKNEEIPILEFYGMWNDISDEDVSIMEESMQKIRKEMLRRYNNDE